jgi:hypothetical protein
VLYQVHQASIRHRIVTEPRAGLSSRSAPDLGLRGDAVAVGERGAASLEREDSLPMRGMNG